LMRSSEVLTSFFSYPTLMSVVLHIVDIILAVVLAGSELVSTGTS
jgi:hypothetical protein